MNRVSVSAEQAREIADRYDGSHAEAERETRSGDDPPPLYRREFRVRADFLACANEIRLTKGHETLIFCRLEAGPRGVGVIVTASDGGRIFTAYDEFGYVEGGPLNVIVPDVFLKQARHAAKGADGFGVVGDDDGALRVCGHAPAGQAHLNCSYSVPFSLHAEARCVASGEWFDWRSVVRMVEGGKTQGSPPCFAENHTKDMAKLAKLLGSRGCVYERGGHHSACAFTFPGVDDALLIVMSIETPGAEGATLWTQPGWSRG